MYFEVFKTQAWAKRIHASVTISDGQKTGMPAERFCRSGGERFCSGRKFEAAGILCVFQSFKLHERGKRSGAWRQGISRVCLKKKGAGRTSHSPRSDSRFALSDVLLTMPGSAAIRQTEPCGPSRGGGQEPCGHWK